MHCAPLFGYQTPETTEPKGLQFPEKPLSDRPQRLGAWCQTGGGGGLYCMGRDLRSPDSLSGHLSRDTGVETTGRTMPGSGLLSPYSSCFLLNLNFMSDSDNRLSGHWIPLLVPSPREATLNKSPYSIFTITCLFHWHIEGRHLCLAFGDRHSQGYDPKNFNIISLPCSSFRQWT